MRRNMTSVTFDYFFARQEVDLLFSVWSVAVIEAQLGQTWPELIKSAAAGGIAVAIDAPTQGAVVMITAEDEETPQRI